MIDSLETVDINLFQEMCDRLLSGLGDRIFILNRELKIIYSNRRSAPRNDKDLTGKNCYTVFHKFKGPCIDEGLTCPALRTLETGKPARVVHTHFEADGNKKFVEVNTYPLRDKNGNITQVIAATSDVTERQKKEIEAEWSREYLFQLIQNSGDAIITLDPELSITSWNRAAEKIYGWTENEVLSKNLLDVLKGHAPEVINALEKAKQGKIISGLEIAVSRKDSSEMTVSITCSPIRDIEGSVIGISYFSRDVSERKRMEQKIADSERYLRNLIESTSDAIISLDAEGKIVLINEGAEKMFGYSREELIGKNIFEGGEVKFYGDIETAIYVMQKIRNSADGKISNLEVAGKTRDGREIQISVSASMLKKESGEFIGTMGVVIDITERKKLEYELKKKVTELEEFYNLAVGRELKMIELKKEIASLKMRLRELQEKK